MQGGRKLKIRQFTGSLVKGIILGMCVYGFMKWQSFDSMSSDVTSFATDACVDEASSRYDISNPKPYKAAANSTGYVVRVSVTTASGKPAKVICLANAHGGISDVTIDER
jgi:hypothetical protein